MEPIILNFESKITPIKPVNDEMTLCRCYIMALGKNSHNTSFSKEAVDEALPTLFNVPVVGHIFVNKDGEKQMGGHDRVVVKDENGQYAFKMITVPYGTVPYQDNVHYEEVDDKDGVKRTYLVGDLILWTGRYPELMEVTYSDEVYFNHSMEIKALAAEKNKDGSVSIKKFKFSALCLLGKSDVSSKNVAPTFPSSKVEPYEFSDEQWNQLFEEFQNKLAETYGSTQYFEKGGKTQMNTEKINEILAEFAIKSVEDLTFSVSEDMTEEQLRGAITEMLQANKPEDTTGDPASEEGAAEGQSAEKTPAAEEPANDGNTTGEGEYSLTAHQKAEALSDAVGAMGGKTAEGEVYYYMIDFCDKFVYVCCFTYGYNGEYKHSHYRFAYTEENSKVAIDDASREEIVTMYLTPDEAAAIDKQRGEYAELIAYKQTREEDDHKKEVAAVIAEFSDLADYDEFKSAVSKSLEFASIDDFREKLYAIRGKYGTTKAQSNKVEDVRIPIDFAAPKAEKTYEQEFFDKYLPKN